MDGDAPIAVSNYQKRFLPLLKFSLLKTLYSKQWNGDLADFGISPDPHDDESKMIINTVSHKPPFSTVPRFLAGVV